jgi:hypothetical protein
MPFSLDPNTGVWTDDQRRNGPSNDPMGRNPPPGFQLYPGEGFTSPGNQGGGGYSSPGYPGGGQLLGPTPYDPNARGQGTGNLSPGNYMPNMFGGYYGYPQQPEGDPFADISRSLEAALMAMQNQLGEQQQAWLEESKRRQSELSALEEAKKKRLLLGAKGRAGNILSTGSGITAQGGPVSKAVLY